MEKRDLPPRRAQHQKAVVLHFHVPEKSVGVSLHLGELAQEAPGQVDEVDTLVNELSAAGAFPAGAPFALVSGPPAVPIARPQVHERTQLAGPNELECLSERAVIAVIEPDADMPA